MPVAELLGELEQAATRGREPFNAPAFREIVKRKDVVQPLLKSITDSSQKEYFKLMALKRLDAASYAKVPPKRGAAILTDALAKSDVFNAWGIPNHYWESSAKAIIEYGADAGRIATLLTDADLLIDIAGVNRVTADRRGGRPSVFVDIDPGYTQIRAAQGDAELRRLLDEHAHLFTIGENIGTARSP